MYILEWRLSLPLRLVLVNLLYFFYQSPSGATTTRLAYRGLGDFNHTRTQISKQLQSGQMSLPKFKQSSLCVA